MVRPPDSGNVLFLILIAVALFAALSYAVTSASKGGGSDAKKESSDLLASQIIQYTGSMRTAILRMRMNGNCADTDISFETPSTLYDYAHVPPVSDQCKLFNPAGGGMDYQEPAKWFDPVKWQQKYAIWVSGNYSVALTGTSNSELMLYLIGLTQDVCAAINRQLGITYTGAIPSFGSVGSSGTLSHFTGTYGPGTTYGDTVNDVFKGRSSGCYKDASLNHYAFYDVLIER